PMTDQEIARQATLLPIDRIAERLGIPSSDLEHYGKFKAKIPLEYTKGGGDQLRVEQPRGRLVLVSAISPTPAGEGKTTCTLGLLDGLNRIGVRAVAALREPSLGPVFGIKGGATGGGRAQAAPMEDINLHFTGDIYAVERAHNLLAALVDNALHFGTAPGGMDARSVLFRRVIDLNDRSLRKVTLGLGGKANGVPRESGFDITAASELMAILCLSKDAADLQARLDRICLGKGKEGPVLAGQLGGTGALAALLRAALKPNLVQSLEGNPVIMHGGPFANIAQGTNSLLATYTALNHSDVTVTEAGFGFDLGGEKFIDIKCRNGGIFPDALVLVATLRALRYHGGQSLKQLTEPDAEALKRGLENLRKHITNAGHFGLVPLVALNRFGTDTDEEIRIVQEECRGWGVDAVVCDAWALGGQGAEALAHAVMHRLQDPPPPPRFLYENTAPLLDKINTLATRYYGASEVVLSPQAADQLAYFEQHLGRDLLVCMAKTQKSISDNPELLGAPSDYTFRIQEVQISAGAGFIVPIAGEMMRMPGLPKVPAANHIHIDPQGQIHGLF
ncbi:MAG: formate--tetrahydrofolate ligase, partial [Bacteroidota bacterium]